MQGVLNGSTGKRVNQFYKPIFIFRLLGIMKQLHIQIFFITESKSRKMTKNFFFYQGFLHRHWWFTGQQGKGGDHLLFHSTTSTLSRTLRHLFATLHVRWPSRIFNRNACLYQTTTLWDLPPYRITIGVIDRWCNVCLFTCWIDTRFLLEWFINPSFT